MLIDIAKLEKQSHIDAGDFYVGKITQFSLPKYTELVIETCVHKLELELMGHSLDTLNDWECGKERGLKLAIEILKHTCKS